MEVAKFGKLLDSPPDPFKSLIPAFDRLTARSTYSIIIMRWQTRGEDIGEAGVGPKPIKDNG